MYKMKAICLQAEMSYETLKFYCKEGLIPNVKRDEHNHRIFDEADLAWIKGLQCLRKCGMSIKDMKRYMDYCMIGEASIPQRKVMLKETEEELYRKQKEIQESLQYIHDKQRYYDDILEGNITYASNLIKGDQEE